MSSFLYCTVPKFNTVIEYHPCLVMLSVQTVTAVSSSFSFPRLQLFKFSLRNLFLWMLCTKVEECLALCLLYHMLCMFQVLLWARYFIARKAALPSFLLSGLRSCIARLNWLLLLVLRFLFPLLEFLLKSFLRSVFLVLVLVTSFTKISAFFSGIFGKTCLVLSTSLFLPYDFGKQKS